MIHLNLDCERYLIKHENCGTLFLRSHNQIKRSFECEKCKIQSKDDILNKKIGDLIAEKRNGKCINIWNINPISPQNPNEPIIKATWECKNGYRWDETFENVIGKLLWCPHCKKRSSVELIIEKVLKNIGYSLNDLKIKEDFMINPESGKFLKVDFFIKKENVAIYCIKKQDVIQKSFNSVEDSRKRIELRKWFCQFNNIKFIEIFHNYSEELIRDILTKEIGNKNFIENKYEME